MAARPFRVPHLADAYMQDQLIIVHAHERVTKGRSLTFPVAYEQPEGRAVIETVAVNLDTDTITKETP